MLIKRMDTVIHLNTGGTTSIEHHFARITPKRCSDIKQGSFGQAYIRGSSYYLNVLNIRTEPQTLDSDYHARCRMSYIYTIRSVRR